jgi:hypothetical protein
MRYLFTVAWVMWLTSLVTADDVKSFTTKEAQEAQAKYKKDLETLQKLHAEGWEELHLALQKDLAPVRKKALEADDLDEAQRIVETIKYLQSLKTGEATKLSVLSAQWVTAERKEDVTKRVKNLLESGEPLSIDGQCLQVQNPSRDGEKTLVLKLRAPTGKVTLPVATSSATLKEEVVAFTSGAAKDAQAKYEKAAAGLELKQAEDRQRARDEYIKALMTARKKAIEAEALEDATLIVETIKKLKDELSGLPAGVRVLSAEWGINDRKVDVTKRVNELLNSGKAVRGDPETLQVQDPSFGVVKTLSLKVQVGKAVLAITATGFHGVQIEIVP